jgi:pyrroline-5-carboxylate reductase
MTSKIAVIGAGMMGGVIVKSLIKGGLRGKITAADAMPERVKEMEKLGVAATSDNRKAAATALKFNPHARALRNTETKKESVSVYSLLTTIFPLGSTAATRQP